MLRKNIIGITLALTLASLLQQPGLAQAAGDATTTKASSASDGGFRAALGKFPQNVVAFTAGALIGTPIAILRKSAQETVNATKDLVGERTNPLLVWPAGAFSVPWAIMSGVLEGPYYGIKNSWRNSSEKPFSKESFSLGEM